MALPARSAQVASATQPAFSLWIDCRELRLRASVAPDDGVTVRRKLTGESSVEECFQKNYCNVTYSVNEPAGSASGQSGGTDQY